MKYNAAIDRCGLKLLVLILSFMITGIGDPPAALHVIAAVAAALAASGALGAVLPPVRRSPLPHVRPGSFFRAALSRGNAGRFIATALFLAFFAFVLPAGAVYAVFAVVCTVLAVVCLSRRD